MNITLENTLKQKTEVRKDWCNATMEDKLRALIQMQRLARNMAKAANRPFAGCVWHESLSEDQK